MRKRRLIVGTVMIAAVYLWPAAALAQDDLARGKEVYAEQKCKLCHSIDGVGNKKGPIDDVGARLSADEIRQWLLTPNEMAEKIGSTRKPKMKVYDKVPEADLEAVILYVQSLKGS